MTSKMPKKEKKEKREIPLRPRGEVIQAQERPSKVLFEAFLEQEKAAGQMEKENFSPPPTTPYHPLPPPTTKQENKTYPVSPQRDFTKFANSLVRDAVPSGLFKGTSKNTYDALYQRTRGAIEPVRKIKAVQSDVLRWANVSHNTLRAHLKHLDLIGLVKIHYRLGDNTGAEYEVFLPEEIGASYHLLPPPTTTQQELVSPSNQNLVAGGRRLEPENIGSNEVPNTLLKTLKNIDDETAIIRSFERLDEAARAATGGGLTKKDAEAFESIIGMIIDLTTVAATKTDSVTSYLKFAEANLKKRLASAPRSFEKKSDKPFEPGSPVDAEKAEPETEFEPESLTAEQRENALVIYRPLVKEKGIEAFENARWQFVEEDFDWLMEELKKVSIKNGK